jgi:hypothetical protein
VSRQCEAEIKYGNKELVMKDAVIAKGEGQMNSEKAREEKLAKLRKIIATIEKDKKRGKRLFFFGGWPDQVGVYDYYKSKRTAQIENKREEAFYEEDGCLNRTETIYPNVDEVDMDDFMLYLRNKENPFNHYYYSYSDYPYQWMQEISDLFLSDSEGRRSGWNEYLFPDEEGSKG